MERKRMDLDRLPTWLQYIVALAVTAVVVIAAWLVGRDNPVPAWIDNYLIPGLGWVGLCLIVVIVVSEIKKRL